MKKDCSMFENKSEKLKSLFSQLKSDISILDKALIDELNCLLCKNNIENINGEFIAFFTELTDKNSYNYLNWYGLARFLSLAGFSLRAEEAYEKAVLYCPNDYEILYGYCKALLNNRKVEQAKHWYFNVAYIIDKKDFFEFILKIADCYFALNEKEKSKQILLSFKPKSEEIFGLGERLFQFSLFDEALVFLLQVQNNVSAKKMIAEIYFVKEEYEKSLDIFNEISNDEKSYLLEISACLSNLNQHEKAISIYNKILESEPNNTVVLLNYAKTLRKIGNTEKMCIYANRCLEIEPNDIGALKFFATYYNEIKNFDEAENYYLKIYNLTNCDNNTITSLCLVLLKKNKHNDIINLYKKLFSNNVGKSIDYLIYGIALQSEKKYDEAISTYLRSYELSKDKSVLEFIGEVYLIKDEINKAKDFFEKCYMQDKNDKNYILRYVEVLKRKNLHMDAIEFLKKVHISIGMDEIVNQIGVLYCSKGLERFNDAIEYFEKATRLNNEPFVYRSNLLYAYFKSNKLRDFIAVLENDTNKIYKENIFVLMKALVLLRKGKQKESLALLDNLIDNCNHNINAISTEIFEYPFYLLAKALVLYDLKDYDAVIEMKELEEPQLIEPDSFKRMIGLSYLNKGGEDNLRKAVKHLAEAEKLRPNNAFNSYNLALAYYYLGDCDNAFSFFKKAYQCPNAKAIEINYYIFDKIKCCSDEAKKFAIISFWKINECCDNVRSILRYTYTRPVFHYTKSSILKILTTENAKFRMNNSAFMNDPREGKAFDSLIEGSISRKNQIDNYDVITPSNVYLASFCSEADHLPMWIEYGDKGRGCSIGFSNQFFDKSDIGVLSIYAHKIEKSVESYKGESIVSFLQGEINIVNNNLLASIGSKNYKDEDTEKLSNILTSLQNLLNSSPINDFVVDSTNLFTSVLNLQNQIANDKYCLYSVCYLDKTNKNHFINYGKPESNKINKKIKLIIKILVDLRKNKNITKEEKEIIIQLLYEELESIKYLFKDSDYSHEKEIRLIKSVMPDDKRICEEETDETHNRVFINIEKPIDIEEIVFGPKVTDSDKMVAFLSKRKLKSLKRVRRSTIKYR